VSNYTQYPSLIHTLTQVEIYDELLMKNHHKHPMGAAPLPEIHSVQNNKRFMGSSSGDPENMPDKHKFNKKQKPNPMQKGDTKAKK
jgi:hypothetical protein